MKHTLLTAAALAVTLLGSTAAIAQYGPPPPPPGYYHQHDDRDDAPREFHEFGRQGFHDGMEGAERDIQNHRRPDVRNRDEFRHPHVPGFAKNEYRDGFRRGYDIGIQRILGGGRYR